MGAFCTTADWMLASRFIEGAGIGLITIVAPAAIAIWFLWGDWRHAVGIVDNVHARGEHHHA